MRAEPCQTGARPGPVAAGALEDLLLDKRELEKVQTYLRRTFQNTQIRVVARPRKQDSAEVYIGEEFVGVLFLDDEDGDRSYNFQMAILEQDLEG